MQYPGEMTQIGSCFSSIPAYPNETMDRLPQHVLESQWIERAQGGDLQAFNSLVLAYQDLVYRQALWILHEEEAAKDATQETFLKAYRKIGTFLRGKPFRSWLLRIATNQCLDMIRRAKSHPHQSLEPTGPDGDEIETGWIKDPAESPEQAIERKELERKISGAIQGLPPDYRTVIVLVDLQELNYADVSEILAVPIGTMKSRLSRARRQLRQELMI